jgi:nucleoside-diphosphate-sugar epimerase
MARYLISGSSGFLGSELACRLTNQGHTVIGVDIVPGVFTTHLQPIESFDISTNYDAVFHFAAYVKGREEIENNFLAITKNIEIDRIVIEKIIQCPPERFVYPSSSAVYPTTYQQDVHKPLCETDIDFATNTIGVSDHLYGWTKLTTERMLWELKDTIDISIIRPFSGYGSKQSLDYPVPNLINIVKNNPNNIKVWGTGEQTRDFVYIDDIVDTLEWCLTDTTKFRVVNVGTGIATSFVEVIQLVHMLVHNSYTPEIKRILTKPVGVLNRYCDATLQKQLGIYPKISLEQGIKLML